MAITSAVVSFMCHLQKQGVIGRKMVSVLDFGEQNWFGDLPPTFLIELADYLGKSEDTKAAVIQRLQQILESNPPNLFDIAKLFFGLILCSNRYRAIDLHGTEVAERLDLNYPVDLGEQFDLCLNLGTAEHVFNQYQFFKTVHEATKVGGVMIHMVPNQGCYDHGFYNYHPTFFFDLSRENSYLMRSMAYVSYENSEASFIGLPDRVTYVRLAVERKLAAYSHLFIAFEKLVDTPFKGPMQGYYDNAIPPDLAAAWSRLPR